MKVQYVSDLHLEFIDGHEIYDKMGNLVKSTFEIPIVGDVVILAGDIHNGTGAHRWVKKWAEKHPEIPFLMILGNHDFWGEQWIDLVGKWRKVAKDIPNLHFMEKDVFEYNGVTFLGTTLWTDMDPDDVFAKMHIAQQMNDYYLISKGDSEITIDDTLEEHWRSRFWLRDALATAKGKKVVITHHLPSKRLIEGRWARSQVSAAYYATCDFLLEKADVWVHGHQHLSHDVVLDGCRVLCNPMGYCGVAENKDFNPEACFEI